MGKNLIRYWYEQRGKTREDVAAYMGRTTMTIWRWETHESDLGIRALKRLAHFLNVPPTSLMPELNSIPSCDGPHCQCGQQAPQAS